MRIQVEATQETIAAAPRGQMLGAGGGVGGWGWGWGGGVGVGGVENWSLPKRPFKNGWSLPKIKE